MSFAVSNMLPKGMIMRRGLLLGGLLIVSSTAIAMDYSHPAAPSNTTECVDYATIVVDAVEAFSSSDTPRDLSDEDIENMMNTVNEIEEQETYNEIRKMILLDAYTWYRSSKYNYDSELAFLQLKNECVQGVMDAEFDDFKRENEEMN